MPKVTIDVPNSEVMQALFLVKQEQLSDLGKAIRKALIGQVADYAALNDEYDRAIKISNKDLTAKGSEFSKYILKVNKEISDLHDQIFTKEKEREDERTRVLNELFVKAGITRFKASGYGTLTLMLNGHTTAINDAVDRG